MRVATTWLTPEEYCVVGDSNPNAGMRARPLSAGRAELGNAALLTSMPGDLFQTKSVLSHARKSLEVAISIRMDCAIYARVSTTDQNCEMQLRELREYCQRRGWKIDREYVDTGWSGAKASRPQFDLLMADARMRRFDSILVWKLDRWGRSVSNCLATIQELRQLGVRWMAVTQNLDTDENNPTARLILHILASVAEFEREMIRERIKAGMNAAKHRGTRCGRPRLQLDRARILKLRQSGASVRAIAKQLELSIGTVHKVVRENSVRKR